MNKETQIRTTLIVEELKPNTPRRRRRIRGIFSIGQLSADRSFRTPFSVRYPS